MGVVTEERALPYGRQWIDDDDVQAVVDCLRSDFLTQGPAVKRFEDSICEATGARFAVAVASGTAALHLASLAAGVRPGDVGITPTITFVASANGVRYAGGTVHFADVDPTTGLVALPSIEERVAAARPKVIIPVDLTGAVADLPGVQAIAKRAGALVVEDAAHSLGADYEYAGERFRAASCAHSDMAILSFHPVKHVTTGEGGAITTNNETLYRELLDLRTHGITKDPAKLEKSDGPWYYEQRTLGFHYRISDLQCALGVSQMKKLSRFVARRRELAARYDAAFSGFGEKVSPLVVPPGVRSAYHLYVVRVTARDGESLESVAERRKRLYLRLADKRIFAQVHYIPVHRQPDFRRHGMGSEVLPGADRYYASCLSLPMFPAMSDLDAERVASAVLEAL